MKLGKYSIGIGDRFNHQAKAQLEAVIKAKDNGLDITPVWNKSFREHEIIRSHPSDTKKQVDAAVKELKWKGDYFIDADHINIKTVDMFIESSDFFTLDVADSIGIMADGVDSDKFFKKVKKYVGELELEELCVKLLINENKIRTIGNKYLRAVKSAAKIYKKIADIKGTDDFIVEISMDETDAPQTPIDLFFILSAISQEGIPVQTIAPKFSGRFNKGVDYVGNVGKFEKEFELDIAVIKKSIQEFNLPDNLKLSVHSGSDKFSIYKSIKEVIKKYDAGIHIKTAGTTWLEELIGLASAGGEGLDIAKEIYTTAFQRFDELCTPYKSVIDIDTELLPLPNNLMKWDGERYVDLLRHDPINPNYNPNFRQLLHVGYKIAAEMGTRYISALIKFEDSISKNVTKNLFERHINRIFM